MTPEAPEAPALEELHSQRRKAEIARDAFHSVLGRIDRAWPWANHEATADRITDDYNQSTATLRELHQEAARTVVDLERRIDGRVQAHMKREAQERAEGGGGQ